MSLIPVILSGGVGSRLWPVSRQSHPKPFMPLPDGDNLIRKTYRRACDLKGVEEVLTVTNRELLFKTEDEYHLTGKSKVKQSFILEPFGKNTAAAITAGALHLNRKHGPKTLMLVLAADHLIQDEASFAKAVSRAQDLASQGWLVTFGINPTSPETGFGYIESDEQSPLGDGLKVKRFVEKPDLATATEYLNAGNYFWNSGMFCFQVGALLDEMKQHCPDVLKAVEHTLTNSRLSEGQGKHAAHSSLSLDSESFAKTPDISIDYALMEHSSKVATIPCDIGWSDVGSWDAMSALVKADDNANRFEGEVIAWNSSENYVRSPNRLTALVGVDNLVVVDTSDALLVAHKDQAQGVKHVFNKLKKEGHDAHLIHQTVHRPWGTYTVLEEGDRFKMKRIVVKPGASLSLQMHYHRSEHWIVVSGTARVVNGDKEILLDTNESTFIPIGHKHRLENPGLIDLILIEVQTGDYLGEDDIVRFDDVYGRA